MLGIFQRHILKGDYPSNNFPRGNFLKVRLALLRRRRLQLEPSAAARTGYGRALRLGQTWEFVSWENTLGKLPLPQSRCNDIEMRQFEFVAKTSGFFWKV